MVFAEETVTAVLKSQSHGFSDKEGENVFNSDPVILGCNTYDFQILDKGFALEDHPDDFNDSVWRAYSHSIFLFCF